METDNIDYDYIGGHVSGRKYGRRNTVLFNHGDIAEICYRGYEDEEREEFINRIQEIYDNNKEN